MSNKAISVFLEAAKHQAEEKQQPAPSSRDSVASPVVIPEKPIEAEQVSGTEKQPANITVSKHANKKTSKLVNLSTSKHVYINKYLSEKAYRTASWRVPQEVVDKFEEMYHLAKYKYRSDVKRYELIVAALALFLWDFETNGEESDLYKLLIKKDDQTV